MLVMTITPDVQTKLLDAESCGLYLQAVELKISASVALKEAPRVQAIAVPDNGVFMNEAPASNYTYPRTLE
ncbi:AMP-binding enzyme [Penicillium citrinum]|uniref:AMP-binding enzyme n=1 Tax=Penicillium citrinum TaxID=5077 RepID=A0A9W9TGA8_PENCI|nr:AMP-binding enzyme [Penicillium citrinum]KAJ5221613.1 AMP-binding enzyme [Penicillium citrinum]